MTDQLTGTGRRGGEQDGLTVAMATAISASVTVSMGELTIGVRILRLRVMLVVRSTCTQKASSMSLYQTSSRLLQCSGAWLPVLNAHLVCAEVDVAWVEDDIVVGVADALGEHLGGGEACRGQRL